MANVTIPVASFVDPLLVPSVCVVTGRRSETRIKLAVTRTPFWVWFLAWFPLVFIPSWVFATERLSGSLPVTNAVHRRLRRVQLVRTASVGALLLTSIAVFGAFIGLVPWVVAVGIVAVTGVLLVLAERSSAWSVKVRFADDPDHVVIEGAAPGFANAVGSLLPYLG